MIYNHFFFSWLLLQCIPKLHFTFFQGSTVLSQLDVHSVSANHRLPFIQFSNESKDSLWVSCGYIPGIRGGKVLAGSCHGIDAAVILYVTDASPIFIFNTGVVQLKTVLPRSRGCGFSKYL